MKNEAKETVSNGVVMKEADKKKLENKPPFKVRVARPDLNVRKGPDFAESSFGFSEEGVYEITEVRNGFGKLAEGPGWICLQYTEPVE